VDAADKDKIESAMKDLEEALKGDDKDAINAKTEALMTAAQKLGKMVYADKQAKEAAGAAGQDPSHDKPHDDNVVDAEFTEVKDKK